VTDDSCPFPQLSWIQVRNIILLGNSAVSGNDRRAKPKASIIDKVATRSYIREMKTMGIRELKNRLSEVVRAVKAGEHILVTDRGTVVAELVPPGRPGTDPGVPPGLARLVERGIARLGAPNDPGLYRGLPPLRQRPVSVGRLLDDERGAR
jgi:prevent-host-death family protein